MRIRCFTSWIVLWPLGIILFLYPINDLFTRTGLILSIFGLWAGCIYFSWRNKGLRILLLSLTSLIFCFLICPGRNYDQERLRREYLDCLSSYEGTRYIWGGENKLGIDCSGLVRAGLIKASFHQGISTANPRLVRYSLSLWWHDSTAEALGKEFRNQTRYILNAKNINNLDQSKTLPGDIAVTDSGVHVLSNLGNGEWIEADPNLGKVVVVKIPALQNPWFQEPIRVMRWTILETR